MQNIRQLRVWDGAKFRYSGRTPLMMIGFWKFVAISSNHPVQEETGLKDKKGTDIFQGDIIEKTNAQTNQKTGRSVVRYNIQSARFTGLALGTSKNMEVIGNIYEPPQQ